MPRKTKCSECGAGNMLAPRMVDYGTHKKQIVNCQHCGHGTIIRDNIPKKEGEG